MMCIRASRSRTPSKNIIMSVSYKLPTLRSHALSYYLLVFYRQALPFKPCTKNYARDCFVYGTFLVFCLSLLWIRTWCMYVCKYMCTKNFLSLFKGIKSPESSNLTTGCSRARLRKGWAWHQRQGESDCRLRPPRFGHLHQIRAAWRRRLSGWQVSTLL